MLSYISTWELLRTFEKCEKHSAAPRASLCTSLVFLKIPACLYNSTMHSFITKVRHRQTIRTARGSMTSRYTIWFYTFTVICNGWPRLDSTDREKCYIKYWIMHLLIPNGELCLSGLQLTTVWDQTMGNSVFYVACERRRIFGYRFSQAMSYVAFLAISWSMGSNSVPWRQAASNSPHCLPVGEIGKVCVWAKKSFRSEHIPVSG